MIPKGIPGGFALIEALVALTLLAASLGATAGLLVQALRQEREAAARVAATRLASSLADELRLLQRTDCQPLLAVTGSSATPSCSDEIGDCATELAAAQALMAWRARVSASLPEGSWSRVEVLDTAAPSYLIQVAWPALGPEEESSVRLAVEL
jgi:type IV pilus modification protein PilV